MQLVQLTTQKEITAYENLNGFDLDLNAIDGDMMILNQGKVALEVTVHFKHVNDALEVKAFVYEYQSEESIFNFSHFGNIQAVSDSKLVSLTVFDDAKEAKHHMLIKASDSMLLNSFC